MLDKTGTITKGEPELTDFVSLGEHKDLEILRLAAIAEKGSEHPLGQAIVNGAKAQKIDVVDPSDFAAIPGHGIRAVVYGATVLLGNRKLLKENGVDTSQLETVVERLEEQGRTAMLMAVDDKPAGVVAVADTIKEHSAEAIKALQKLGIKVYMITGDNQRTAYAIGEQVGIDSVLAEVLPEDKADHVERLRSEWWATASTMRPR